MRRAYRSRLRLWPLGLALAQTIFAVRLHAQNGDAGSIFFDAVTFAGEAGTTPFVDLFLAVPSSRLSFERDGDAFTARYRVRLELARSGRSVRDTTIERTTTTRHSDVASSTRPTYDFFQHRVAVDPGAYEARVEIIDPRSSVSATSRRAFTAADHAALPISLSGLMLVERIREDSSGFVMTPRLSESVDSDGDDYFLFFESYNALRPVDARLEVRYVDGTSVVARRTLERSLPAGRSQQWIALDADGVNRGAYTLELVAMRRDDTTDVLATTSRTLRVEGTGGVPHDEAELDERIAQLRHVAPQSDIEQMRTAATPAERRRRYAEFWERLDPTPGTRQNEAMEEYLSRVDYASEHFRSYAPGWMTDQGRVYILYGAPDRVARDPFRPDGRRIETWHYYARANLEVAFEDDSGFGDYRLLTPVSPLEKYRYGGQ